MSMKFLAAFLILAAPALAHAATTINVPDDGWRLWPDTHAKWKDDTLYLPDEAADVSRLPVNSPTGGWSALDQSAGVAVSLPSTVEQHFWGNFGTRPYDPNEYAYSPGVQNKPIDPVKADTQVVNGNYEGVSWWWRSIDLPADFKSKVAILHIRGARQRAEVFVNRQLVGYDLVEETAFDCDVTKAIHPGEKNEIAIRITNPGGRLDWIDYTKFKWGKYEFQQSHGFGGLDRGITLSAYEPIYVQDSWVLNTAAPHSITAHAAVKNTMAAEVHGTVHFDVVEPASGKVIASVESPVTVHANETSEASAPITCDQAQLWELEAPHLYELRARLSAGDIAESRNQSFGFRSFEPRGIGSEAGLYLNDHRVRLLTAISWGYWGLNGLWPTPELAEKEVKAAKQLNLSMLNFHRNIGKEDVLAKQDELGLLRYMEPGGGGTYFKKRPKNATTEPNPDTSGAGGEPKSFAERYIEAKVERMVKQFRSHPSLTIYVLQNETEPDFADPNVFYLLRKVHELDPSRVVAAKSGISFNNQAWFPPYAKEPMLDDGTGNSGWHDRHSVGGPGVWQDNLYRDPTRFTHQIDERKEIVDWGEMLGAAVPDNHAKMIEQIKASGGSSYDLRDHQEPDDAYTAFLDKWGFRKAFPSNEAFYSELGSKQYEFWGRVIETARLSESNDILTISGWESTAIEDHSGIVDNMRNFHGDPQLISAKLAPILPVTALHGSIFNVGDKATYDVFFLNDTNRNVSGKLQVTLKDPTGTFTALEALDLPKPIANQCVYSIKTDLTTPVLNSEGTYTLSISVDGDPTLKNSQTLHVYQATAPHLPSANVGVITDEPDSITKRLEAFPQIHATPFKEGEHYDLIVVASMIVKQKSAPMDKGAPSAKVEVEPDPAPLLSDAAIQAIRSGTPLLAMAGDERHGRVLAKQLADAGAFKLLGTVPSVRASWMGNWVFPRTHPLYDGLPTNQVMKGDYQIGVTACYGLMVDGPDVTVVAGYGRDHDRRIGAATFTSRLNGTPIVFQAVNGMHRVVEQRCLSNAITYLLHEKVDSQGRHG